MSMEMIGTTIRIPLPEDFEYVTNEGFKYFEGVPGIYFLMNNSELIYIGQSKDIRKRVKAHVWGCKIFNGFMYLKIDEQWERDFLEMCYIDQLQPKYNHHGAYMELSVEQAIEKIERENLIKDFEKVTF